ncbi:MAG: glycosyltransferase [Pseudomonadota bacterium]
MQPMTCIICVRNGENLLAEALASADAALGPDDDLLVIDDASTDRSGEIAATTLNRPVRVISIARAGIAGARNAGLTKARTEVIAFLDHDDLWDADGLAALRSGLAERPHADGIFGERRDVFADDSIAKPLPGPPQARLLIAGIFRKKVFDRIGHLTDQYPDYAEVDWMMKASDEGAVFPHLPALFLIRRIHAANNSWSKSPDTLLELMASRHTRLRNSS